MQQNISSPIGSGSVEIGGERIKGPDCRLCARMVTCDIPKMLAKSELWTIYPVLTDEHGHPLPESRQVRPFILEKVAAICKWYSPALKSDTLTE